MKFRVSDVVNFLNKTVVSEEIKLKYKGFFEFLEKSFRDALILKDKGVFALIQKYTSQN
jgi:hypothetical protein